MTAPAFVSGYGQHHTDEPDARHRTAYTSIDWPGILALVDDPQHVDKSRAQWLIPSTVPTRSFRRQEAEGAFWLLVADLDADPPSQQRVVDVLETEIVGGADFEVYSSRSATVERPKKRILIPLARPLSGADWRLAQEVLNDLLQQHGIAPDRATERCGQLCYLPNRGVFYESASARTGARFNPLATWADLIAAKRQAIADKADALDAAREAAAARRAARAALPGGTGARNLIDAFNAAFHVAEVLQ